MVKAVHIMEILTDIHKTMVFHNYQQPKLSTAYTPLPSADCLTFDIPRMRMRMGDRALSVAGARAWNALPADIRCAPSLDSNHICFLLLLIYNNFFCLTNCLLLCILCTVVICTVLAMSTQPSIPPGSVNDYQLWLGRQRQVWFIPLADEH